MKPLAKHILGSTLPLSVSPPLIHFQLIRPGPYIYFSML